MCKINIEMEYLTPEKDVINFHIRENDAFKGKEAVEWLIKYGTFLFSTGVEVIFVSLKKSKETRHIRLTAKAVGMKIAQEDNENIIYYLKRR